jgi:hypothetical protein
VLVPDELAILAKTPRPVAAVEDVPVELATLANGL